MTMLRGNKCIQLMLSRGSSDAGKDGAQLIHTLMPRSLQLFLFKIYQSGFSSKHTNKTFSQVQLSWDLEKSYEDSLLLGQQRVVHYQSHQELWKLQKSQGRIARIPTTQGQERRLPIGQQTIHAGGGSITFRPQVVAPVLSSVQESDKMKQDKGRRQIPKCMHLKKILMVKKTEIAPSMAPYHPLDKSKILRLAPRPSRFQPLSAILSMFTFICQLLPYSLSFS